MPPVPAAPRLGNMRPAQGEQGYKAYRPLWGGEGQFLRELRKATRLQGYTRGVWACIGFSGWGGWGVRAMMSERVACVLLIQLAMLRFLGADFRGRRNSLTPGADASGS